jgi:predicted amidohydrolase YtcJ
MAGPILLIWGLGLSAVVAVIAVVLRLQEPLFGSGVDSQTFCYQGIRTHDEDKPHATCFALSGGIFTNVFTADNIGSDINHPIESGYVIPGLWDGHGHLLRYGEFLQSVDLFGSSSIDDVRARIAEYLDSHPDAGTKEHWVRGIGWDQTAFGRMPTSASTSEPLQD